MKKLILFAFILVTSVSCTSTKTIVITDYDSTFKIEEINIREIALKDAYEAFPTDTILIIK